MVLRFRLLTAVASLIAEHRLSCSAACGIFPDQGSNSCHQHRQANSQPLDYQGSPITSALFCVCACVSHVQLFPTPQTLAQQAPMSMEFSRQEYWSGLPFPSPRDLSDPETEPASCISYVGRQIPHHCATGKPNSPLNDNLNLEAAQTILMD